MRNKLLAGISAAVLAAMPVGAVAQEQPRVLRIGMLANDGGDGINGLAEIRRGFAKASGREVRIFAATSQASLIEAQAGGRLHYAILSSAGFAAAQRLCGCVEPLAAPVGSGGDVGLRAVVLARSGGPASLVEAASGRIIAGPADSVGPQLLAMDALARAGAGNDVVLADTLEAAEDAFARGDATVLLGWESADPAGAGSGGSPQRLAALGLDPADYSVIWRSEIIRYGPHSVRSNLPGELKDRLRNFLLGLYAQNPALYDLVERNHLGGFVETAGTDYSSASQMAELVGE